jgi:hypothetical protein
VEKKEIEIGIATAKNYKIKKTSFGRTEFLEMLEGM